MFDSITPGSDKCLYIEDHDCLVLSDLHLGVTYPNKPYPVMEHDEISTRIDRSIEEYSPSKLVLNGDIFNNRIIDEQSIELLNNIQGQVSDLILTKGNHEEKMGGFPDRISDNFTTKRNYKIGNNLIHHGHHTPTVRAERHIIGHVHPMKDGLDVLIGKENAYHGSEVIILPKFSNIVNGSDLYNITGKGHCPIIGDGDSADTYTVIKSYDQSRSI